MEIRTLLSEMIERGGSDLYITTNSPPLVRADGLNQPVGPANYSGMDTKALAESLMNDSEKATFAQSLEMNLAIEFDDIGRFRVQRAPPAG